MARKSAAKYGKKRKPAGRPQDRSWGVAGIDLSITSISGAMVVYDALLDKLRGPGLFSVRWEKPVHFLDRLAYVVRAQDFMHDLISSVGPMPIDPANIWVGVEEAWPAGIVKRAESMWLRQQAQMNGALIGGLVRYGYNRVYEVNASNWRYAVAQEMGVKMNKEFTKWVVKEWAIGAYGVEDRVDLIENRIRGLIPRPDNSKAKAKQPDDIYDACGILAWMTNTREEEVS